MKKLLIVCLLIAISTLFNVIFISNIEAERINYVVAEVNGIPITSFDIKVEELLEGRGESDLIKLIDEKILSQNHWLKVKEEFAKQVKVFGKYEGHKYDNHEEPGYEYHIDPVVSSWSGMRKLIAGRGWLSRFSYKDKLDLAKLFKDKENELLGSVFFPGESHRYKDVQIQNTLFMQAKRLNMKPAFLKEKLVEKALVERALGGLYERLNILCVSPKKVCDCYHNLPEGKISWERAEKKIHSKFMREKIQEEVEEFTRDFRAKAIVGVRSDYSEYLEDSGYGHLYAIGK